MELHLHLSAIDMSSGWLTICSCVCWLRSCARGTSLPDGSVVAPACAFLSLRTGARLGPQFACMPLEQDCAHCVLGYCKALAWVFGAGA